MTDNAPRLPGLTTTDTRWLVTEAQRVLADLGQSTSVLDGVALSEGAQPIRFARDERVRVRLINDSMMAHPIHIHGHFFELVNGHGGHQPLKHTVNVLPGGTVDLDLTADAPGDWAFHCHLLLHMHAGMMRVVTVRPLDGEAE